MSQRKSRALFEFRRIISFSLILSMLFLMVAPGISLANVSDGVSMPNKSDGPFAYRKKEMKHLIELKEKRDRNSKYYLNGDGTYTVEVYPNPRHYKDADGTWQEISNEIVESSEPGFDLQNKANSFQTYFSKKSNAANMVKIMSGKEHSLSWSFSNADKVLAASTESSITYPNILQNVDLQYIPQADGLKENIILQNSTAPNTFQFRLMTNGLNLIQQGDGSVNFEDSTTSEVVFRFPKPFMIDSNGEVSNNVDLHIVPGDDYGKYDVIVSADQSWLKDATRAFPVTIDPITTTTPWTGDIGADGNDTFVAMSGSNVSNQYYNLPYMEVGYDSSLGDTISYVRFPSLPDLPTGSIVTDAVFSVYKNNQVSGSNQLVASRVVDNWDSTKIVYPGPNSDENNTLTESSQVQVDGNYTGWINFSVWTIVKCWLNGGQTNNGFKIRSVYNNDAFKFYTSNYSYTYDPFLSVTYIPDEIGVNPYWSYANTPIGSVNTFNGNLVSYTADFSLPGRGIPISVGRAYNNRGNLTGLFGPKWFSNLDMQLQFFDFGAVFLDSTGTERPFMLKSDGSGYIAPDNYPIQLYKDGTAGYKLQEGNQDSGSFQDKLPTLYFDSSGKLTKLTDGKGNSTTITRVSGYIQIEDSSGRKVTLYQNGDGTVRNIVDNLGAVKVEYTYKDSHLINVTYKDPVSHDTSINYTWQNNLQINSMTDKKGTPFYINYNSNNQVVSVGPDNLLSNPSFEANSDNNRPGPNVDNWDKTFISDNGVIQQSSDSQYGNYSLNIQSNSSGTDPAYLYATQKIAITGGQTYSFYSKIKTVNLGGSATTDPSLAKAFLNVLQLDANGNQISWKDNRGSGISGTTNWTLSSLEVTTNPAAAYIVAYLEVEHDTAHFGGNAYFDGAQIQKGPLSSVFEFQGHTDFRYGTDGSSPPFEAAWITAPKGEVVEYKNDNYGTPAAVITDPYGPNKAETDLSWDAADHLRSLKTPRGKTYSYEYDPLGNIKKATDPNGNQTSYDYYYNRLKTLTMADGTKVQNVWDPTNLNNVTGIVQNLNESAYEYDDTGNLIQESNKLGVADNRVLNSGFESGVPLATATFNRSGGAYLANGSVITGTNQPRFETGKYGQAVTIEEGTTNLLTYNQATVETDLSGFSSLNASLNRTSAVHWEQGNSLMVSVSSAYTNPGVYLPFSMTAGNNYSLSFYYRSDNNLPMRGTVKDGGGWHDFTIPTASTSWQRFTYTFTASNSGTTNMYIQVLGNYNGSFNVDGIQMEQKSLATSFANSTRSPETLSIPIQNSASTQNFIEPSAGTVDTMIYVPSAWQTGIPNWRRIWSVGGSCDTPGWYGVYYNPYDGKMHFSIYGNTLNDIATAKPSVGWHRITARWSPAEMTLFIDGAKIPPLLNPSLPSSFLDSKIAIGSRIDTGLDQGNTQYDDFRISDAYRTDQDITTYDNTTPLPIDAYTSYKLNFDANLTGQRYGYQPDNWTPVSSPGSINSVVYDSSAPFGGGNVLRLNPGGNAYTDQYSAQMFELNSFDTFSLSAYIKAVGSSDVNGACLNVYWFDSNRNQLRADVFFNVRKPNWQRYSITVVPPTNAVYAMVAAVTYGQWDGYYDDIQFEKSKQTRGYNFIDNSSFEKQSPEPSKWSTAGGYTNIQSDADNYSGSYDAQINQPSSGTAYFESQSILPVNASQSYTMTGFIKTGDITGGGGRLHVTVYDSYGAIIVDEATKYVTDSNTEWTKYVKTFQAPKNGTAKIRLESSAIGMVKFDNIRFSSGSLTVSNQYDTNKNYVEHTVNQLQQKTDYSNDNYGQVKSITSPSGEKVQYGYDGQERLKTVTDNAGSLTSYEMDDNGNVLNSYLESGGTRYNNTTFTYDKMNNLLSEIDANNNKTQFSYDEDSRLSMRTNPDGTSVSLGYDLAGRLAKYLLSSGSNYSFDYFQDGRRKSQIVTSGNINTNTFSYDYDGVGNSTSYSETDSSGNTASVSTPVYTPKNQLKSFSLNYNNLSPIAHSFDYLGNGLVASETVDGKKFLFDYDDGDNLISRWNENNTQDIRTYNEANQVVATQTVGVTLNGAGEGKDLKPKFANQYSYDLDGRLSTVEDGQGNKIAQFTYNNGTEKLNRLTFANINIPTSSGTVSYNFNYEYDPAGNIKKMSIPNGNTTITQSFQYDAANIKIQNAGFNYDSKGNLIAGIINGKEYHYSYDSANRLVSVSNSTDNVTTSYTYDGDGMRLSKTVTVGSTANTTNYHYFNGQLMYETQGSTISALYMRSPSGALQAVRLRQGSNDNYYYYHYNAQGDVTAVTDASGNVYRQYYYDPYGNVIKVLDGSGATVDINNDPGFNHAYTYKGYRYDQESGLYFLNARYYAAGIGRFLTKDAFKGVAKRPSSLNRYAYTEGDPINLDDQTGNDVGAAGKDPVIEAKLNGIDNMTQVIKTVTENITDKVVETKIAKSVIAPTIKVASKVTGPLAVTSLLWDWYQDYNKYQGGQVGVAMILSSVAFGIGIAASLLVASPVIAASVPLSIGVGIGVGLITSSLANSTKRRLFGY